MPSDRSSSEPAADTVDDLDNPFSTGGARLDDPSSPTQASEGDEAPVTRGTTSAEPVLDLRDVEPTIDRPEVRAAARPTTFLPTRPARTQTESVFVRLVATAGVVAIATAVGAIMGVWDLAAWLIGLVASLLSVVLAAVLWRSRRL